jgi:TolB-like protein
MRRLIGLALAAVAVLLPSVASAQAAKPVVAVLYFDNNSFGPNRADYENLGKGIADMLINDMASNPNFRVVEREQIQSLLTEQNLTKAGTIDPQTAIKLGKIIGAQYMITGGFMSDGRGTLILTARAINVETSAITNPTKLTSKGDDVLGLINELSSHLNTDMKLPALQVGQAPAQAPTPASQPAATQSTQVTQVASAATDTAKAAAPTQASSTAAPAVSAVATTSTASAAPSARPAAASARPTQKMDLRTALLYSRALEEEDAGNSSRAMELYKQVVTVFPEYAPARAKIAKLSRG